MEIDEEFELEPVAIKPELIKRLAAVADGKTYEEFLKVGEPIIKAALGICMMTDSAAIQIHYDDEKKAFGIYCGGPIPTEQLEEMLIKVEGN